MYAAAYKIHGYKVQSLNRFKIFWDGPKYIMKNSVITL